MARGAFRVNLVPICDRLGRDSVRPIRYSRTNRLFSKIYAKARRIPMNTERSAPVPFEIDRTTPMWENYKQDVQTQEVSAFGGVLVADGEVGSS